MKKTLITVITLILSLTLLASCSAAKNEGDMENNLSYPGMNQNNSMSGEYADEETPGFVENEFISTEQEAVSTFSADVDTASYTYFRKLVNSGYNMKSMQSYAASFRTEEFLNYFRYDAQAPENGELFGVTARIANTPWNEETCLLRLTLQAENAVPSAGNNLVFLIDVSGSMASQDKLPLLQKTFSMLTGMLTEKDTVSIVTYSGKEEVVLRSCPGNQSETILRAIKGLKPGGSTNGESGLKMAYSLAADSFIEGGNNRIIMASDGDLNVGISSPEELKTFVEGKRDQGIYLSVLGFGTGNYRDGNMEALADNGNGVYYYIDGETEAEKVFGTDLLSTLYTVANDVKLQLTFDPDYVDAYRLIGYENRLLDKEDFENDAKDAGEVGAGHQVTVFYELKLTDAARASADGTDTTASADWMKLSVRYKHPGEVTSELNEYTIGAGCVGSEDKDFDFMTAVIASVMVLHNSKNLNGMTMQDVVRMLDAQDLNGYPDRIEFRNLIRSIR